jgi:hypothetical protein
MVREHDFVDSICRWCGGRQSEFFTRLLTCVPRWVEPPPRSTPTSIFNDLTSIGDRMREIQAEEDLPDSSETLKKGTLRQAASAKGVLRACC